MQYYKVLNSDGTPCNGGKGKWSLPGDQPGEWMPLIANIEPCVRGYHLCRPDDLIHWLGPQIYVAEPRGEVIECEDKIVCESARLIRRLETWNEKTARLFACDCAWSVLPIYEKEYPGDCRPSHAINMAYLFTYGKCTEIEMAAAWDAAEAAQTKRLFSAYLKE